MRKSELMLSEVDEPLLREAEERLTANGLTLTTLAGDDTEDNRRKLWELYVLTDRDVPHDSHQDEPFEQFNELLDREECLRDCLVIARDGELFAGFTILGHDTTGEAFTWMTGVHPEYRNRGIALGVKAACVRLARDQGYHVMRTFNHVNNPAMLAVNTRMGYRPLPEGIQFVKTLRGAA
jgi:RimJ/RimL family protein N-acetyltransferase